VRRRAGSRGPLLLESRPLEAQERGPLAERHVFESQARVSELQRRVSETEDPQILADFGLVTRKVPTPLDAAATVVAVSKRKATRAARHTMGKKQKAAITGGLTGPIVVPVDGHATQ
jgi:hypothetical protein